jgi:arylformamidase
MGLLAKSYSGVIFLIVISWINALFAATGFEAKNGIYQEALAQVQATKDIHYGEGEAQVLDVYGADRGATSLRPVMLYVHGGGWKIGDKKRVGDKANFFSSKLGFTFVSMNYRLSDEAKHPAQVEDVVLALRWLKQHAKEYGADGSRISLIGHSAGAHLVALAALKYQDEFSVIIKDVLLVDTAAINLETRWQTSGYFMRRMIKSNFKTDPESLKEASPSTYIDGSVRLPRFLLLAAGRETSITVNKDFQLRLAKRGAQAVYRELPKLNHMEINRLLGAEGAEVTEIVQEFLSPKRANSIP